jgi:hypothetical protein
VVVPSFRWTGGIVSHLRWMNTTSFDTLDLLHIHVKHDVGLTAEIFGSEQLKTAKINSDGDREIAEGISLAEKSERMQTLPRDPESNQAQRPESGWPWNTTGNSLDSTTDHGRRSYALTDAIQHQAHHERARRNQN